MCQDKILEIESLPPITLLQKIFAGEIVLKDIEAYLGIVDFSKAIPSNSVAEDEEILGELKSEVAKCLIMMPYVQRKKLESLKKALTYDDFQAYARNFLISSDCIGELMWNIAHTEGFVYKKDEHDDYDGLGIRAGWKVVLHKNMGHGGLEEIIGIIGRS